jgi:uncharacterized metal-binding protein
LFINLKEKGLKKTIAILMGTAFLFTTNVFAPELMTRAEFKKRVSL